MRTAALAIALLLTTAASPDREAARIERRLAAGGSPLVDPLPDGRAKVTFVWRGAGTTSVLLDWPAWGSLHDSDRFVRIRGSDLWTKSVILPRGARMAYRLVPDVAPGTGPDSPAYKAKATPDPLNRHRWPAGGTDAVSIIDLPGGPSRRWLHRPKGTPGGTLESAPLHSVILANSREVTLYRPARGDPRWLLIVFDGNTYQNKIALPAILDTMIAARAIPPVAVVFLPNPDGLARRRDLACSPDFSAFLARELLPWIGRRVPVPPARNRILAGSSLGGLAAACAAVDRPEEFGAVLSQSGSFWWTPSPGTPRFAPGDDRANWVARRIAAVPRLPLRFYLSAGQLEGVPGDGGILATNRVLRDALRGAGYPVTYAEVPGGHDFYSWRADFPAGLIALMRARP